MPDHDADKKQQEQEAENKIFCENSHLVIENSDRILKKEEFFFCEFRLCLSLYGLYSQGRANSIGSVNFTMAGG